MNRICPKCQHRLTTGEAYFCTKCGNKLDDSLIGKVISFRIRRSSYPSIFFSQDKKDTKQRPKIKLTKSYLLLVLLVFVFSFLFLIYKTRGLNPNLIGLLSTKKTEEGLVVKKRVYPNTVHFSLTSLTGLFGDDEIAQVIPYEVDFFAEGFGFSSLIKTLVVEEDSPFNEIILLLQGIAKDHFAIFGQLDSESGWQLGLVMPLKEQANIEEPLTVEVDKLWYVDTVGSYIVVSSDKDIFTSMEECVNNLAKNVTHRPEYSSSKALLAREGSLFFVSFTERIEEIYNVIDLYAGTEENLPVRNEMRNRKLDKFVVVDYD